MFTIGSLGPLRDVCLRLCRRQDGPWPRLPRGHDSRRALGTENCYQGRRWWRRTQIPRERSQSPEDCAFTEAPSSDVHLILVRTLHWLGCGGTEGWLADDLEIS